MILIFMKRIIDYCKDQHSQHNTLLFICFGSIIPENEEGNWEPRTLTL